MVSIEYHELVQLDAVFARKKLVEIYYHQAGRNISETARVCGLSRHTVRKWLGRFFIAGESGLKDYSRRPHHMPRKTPDEVEELVVGIRKTGRRYYNPVDFAPFEFIQADVKVVADGDTLPEETYLHFKELVKKGVPLYQFTAIDIRTRIRFLAYGQQKSFSNGRAFIVFVLLWLCSFGIKVKITIQTDWGDEFGGDEGKKIAWMNQQLAPLEAEITRIHKGRKEENGYKKDMLATTLTARYQLSMLKRSCQNSVLILHYSHQ